MRRSAFGNNVDITVGKYVLTYDFPVDYKDRYVSFALPVRKHQRIMPWLVEAVLSKLDIQAALAGPGEVV